MFCYPQHKQSLTEMALIHSMGEFFLTQDRRGPLAGRAFLKLEHLLAS